MKHLNRAGIVYYHIVIVLLGTGSISDDSIKIGTSFCPAHWCYAIHHCRHTAIDHQLHSQWCIYAIKSRKNCKTHLHGKVKINIFYQLIATWINWNMLTLTLFESIAPIQWECIPKSISCSGNAEATLQVHTPPTQDKFTGNTEHHAERKTNLSPFWPSCMIHHSTYIHLQSIIHQLEIVC